MNFNQTIAGLALVLLAVTVGLTAYGLRYVPIQGDGFNNPVVLWDRWNREICQVSVVAQWPVSCSRTGVSTLGR